MIYYNVIIINYSGNYESPGEGTNHQRVTSIETLYNHIRGQISGANVTSWYQGVHLNCNNKLINNSIENTVLVEM